MKIKMLLLVPLLLLGSCVKPYQPVKTEYLIVKPDQSMYECKLVTLPDPEKLTDVQTASLINDLYANNKICYNSIGSIKQFLDVAEKIAEQKK